MSKGRPSRPYTWRVGPSFLFDTALGYLIRNRDGIFVPKVIDTLDFMDIEQIVIAPRSPWQNGYCERVIGTIRRECLDYGIVLGEKIKVPDLRLGNHAEVIASDGIFGSDTPMKRVGWVDRINSQETAEHTAGLW